MSIRAVVLDIDGSNNPWPGDPERVRNFEIFRNAQRGIEIVTFDELLAKGKLLLNALTATG